MREIKLPRMDVWTRELLKPIYQMNLTVLGISFRLTAPQTFAMIWEPSMDQKWIQMFHESLAHMQELRDRILEVGDRVIGQNFLFHFYHLSLTSFDWIQDHFTKLQAAIPEAQHPEVQALARESLKVGCGALNGLIDAYNETLQILTPGSPHKIHFRFDFKTEGSESLNPEVQP